MASILCRLNGWPACAKDSYLGVLFEGEAAGSTWGEEW